MRIVFILMLGLMLASCRSIPRISFSWPASEQTKEIAALKEEKSRLATESEVRIAAAKQEVLASQNTRVSQGTSQVYAASDTLLVDPLPSKWNLAANKALFVAKENLPIPAATDLAAANKIQADLLSEQAGRIAEAEKALGVAKMAAIEAKNKEEALKAEQEAIRAAAKAKEDQLAADIKAKEDLLEKERLEWAGRAERDAEKYRYNEVWYRKYNPFSQIGKLFTSLFFWVILFVVVGGALKIANIFFPGTNIISGIVGGIGKAIGGVVGLLFRWIPHSLDGAGAVDKKTYNIVAAQRDNTIAAVEEYKQEKPAEYEVGLKKNLVEWGKDATPEVKAGIDKRLKELNVV